VETFRFEAKPIERRSHDLADRGFIVDDIGERLERLPASDRRVLGSWPELRYRVADAFEHASRRRTRTHTERRGKAQPL
jgi:hypothetical protein